jgi:hypothetical protein
VHAAYAILIWWNSFHWKRGRFAAALFLLLTLIATLGTGQHYLIDLIVAAPYSVMCQALATRTVPSKSLAFWGGGITGLWLILLRWFPSVLVAHPARLWLLALATVLTAFLMGRKLETEAYEDSNG